MKRAHPRLFLRPLASWLLLGLATGAGRGAPPPAPADYFAIEVVDAATGRGVPMVELQTTSSVRYYTDSNGLVAFYEPGLMNRRVWFGVAAHGYEFAPDGFGIRGAVVVTKPGSSARLKIKRVNLAERLYRLTGAGIYRDTILLGRQPPTAAPLLNGEVTGQDGILTAVYRGRTYWFYGDTSRLAYALGNFKMTGATSKPPAALDPSAGIDLTYFAGKDGFARSMAPIAGEGVVWLAGLVILPDQSGRDRMLAYYQRRRGLGAVLENGFVVYNDDREVFEKLKEIPLDPPLHPQGYPLRAKDSAGVEYIYFTAPYPTVRVKADWQSYLDPGAYESYTCNKPAGRSAGTGPTSLERDAAGRLLWAWRRGATPLGAKEQQALIKSGQMKTDESPLRLEDAASGKPVGINNCSCFWNAYRKRYIMIASELFGATVLGEVWYSEADQPEGPWLKARKIITHANKQGDAHDFYNPTQHPFLDQQGGRIIYVEGSYVNTFSGNPHPTPYYEYNQIMYRLDLDHPALRESFPQAR